ncbi:MAG: hypothetical protein WDM79_10540 [Terricaulis sp.]
MNAETRREADAAVDEILFLKKFGAAGQRIVIEDFMPGEEPASSPSATARTPSRSTPRKITSAPSTATKAPTPAAWALIPPAPIFTEEVLAQTMERIILPTMRGMKEEGRPFVGVLFAGLMITPEARA